MLCAKHTYILYRVVMTKLEVSISILPEKFEVLEIL